MFCAQCHGGGPLPHAFPPPAGQGPHGWYSATTDRCDACHSVHDSGGTKLLAGATVTDSCYSCHDGTGGHGVYGALNAQGWTVGAAHRIDTTSAVPGGDPVGGGQTTMSFTGLDGNLGCDDCHSPHDSNTVAAFKGERMRTSYPFAYVTPTSKLLRRNPAGSTTTATVYGSDWCLACHKGRKSGGVVHNHPVDSLTVTTTPYSYSNVALLSTDAPTSVTVTGSMAANNRGYLMPYPRTPLQQGHNPICQQCHEDWRDAGDLDATGTIGDAATFLVESTDGQNLTDNPLVQTFPHEGASERFLVEIQDNLCLNCHPAASLP